MEGTGGAKGYDGSPVLCEASGFEEVLSAKVRGVSQKKNGGGCYERTTGRIGVGEEVCGN